MKYFWGGVAAGVVGTIIVSLAVGLVVVRSMSGSAVPPRTYAEMDAVETPDSVEALSTRFERRILEPLPGVHVAIGYGLANVILIEAPEGLIMVDTLESREAAEGLLPFVDELRARLGQDITDIIYTHNHSDHIAGADVFIESQETRPAIWAHPELEGRVHEVVNILRPIIYQRSMRQFGVYLPDNAYANSGLGNRLLLDETTSIGFAPPDHEVVDGLELNLAGERVVIRFGAGETPDQIFIWLPDRNALLPADNVYHAFPNLYALRGTPYRNPQNWAQTVAEMATYDAETLIPQHGLPVHGADEIRQMLTDYHDAIAFVHDQTIRYINQGLTPDEIVERVELPPHLANAPYLTEYYGRVDWAVRSIFSGTLGWFSGDPADLLPPGPDHRSELMAELAGGPGGLEQAYQQAMANGDTGWALILAGHLDRLGHEGAPAMRAEALRVLASGMTASTGRNYMLTAAAEAEGFVIPPSRPNATPASFFEAIPIENFLQALPVALKAEDVLDIETAYGFDFTDLDTPMTLRIRRGVAVVEPGLADDVQGTLVATSSAFKRVVVGILDPGEAMLRGELVFDTGPIVFQAFMSNFDVQ